MKPKTLINLSSRDKYVRSKAVKRPFVIACSGENLPDDNAQLPAGDAGEITNSENICAFCKQEFTGIPLEKLSVYPICTTCKDNLDKKVFPTWVKLFFAAIIVLVVFSFCWNWRFYSGYLNFNHAFVAYGQANSEKAASLMSKAATEVPESKDINTMASYFKGLNFLLQDKSKEAFTELKKCDSLPAAYHLEQLKVQAEIDVAFNDKNYQFFLTAAKDFLQFDTTASQSWAQVASAYACLYAQNNQDSLKQLSLKYLGKAKSISDTGAVAKDYDGRIQYRLDSRQIISTDEFHKKFPNGYPSK